MPAFPAYQYQADDGGTYQVAQPAKYSAHGAGDLAPALGTEAVFPSVFLPRRILAAKVGDTLSPLAHIVCNQSNPLYQAGPGTQFFLSGVLCTVLECIGERSFVFM